MCILEAEHRVYVRGVEQVFLYIDDYKGTKKLYLKLLNSKFLLILHKLIIKNGNFSNFIMLDNREYHYYDLDINEEHHS
jgi:hypothetical protein